MKSETTKAAGKASIHPLVRPVWMEWIARKAGKNLDKWGVQDFETLGLAVAEEAGELAQAILQNKYEGGERGRISHEALDLAALCVQVLVTMTEKHGGRSECTGSDWPCPCPHCGDELLFDTERGVHCDGCDDLTAEDIETICKRFESGPNDRLHGREGSEAE